MEEVLPNVYQFDTLKYVERGVISAYAVVYDKAAIIDPGTAKGADIILREMDKSWNVELICPTHVHIDHGGGAAKLAKALKAKILAHPRGFKHIVDPERLWEASKSVLGELAEVYGKPEGVEESRVVAVQDGQEFDLGGDELKALYAPGHAPHMLVYYLVDKKVLFPSDAVGMFFNGVVFPLTPPPFDISSARDTLKKLMTLDVDYVAFTHYGIVEGSWVISKALEKIESWAELARDVAAENGNVSTFLERLRRFDEDVEKLFQTLKEKPIALSFIYTSATGLLEAAKR